MQWGPPILTDSGGFQVFSLASLRKITERGVEFRSHLDGSLHFLGPDEAMEIQCASAPTLPWCSMNAFPIRQSTAMRKSPFSSPPGGHGVQGISGGQKTPIGRAETVRYCSGRHVQGSAVRAALPIWQKSVFDGYAVGGLSVGEPKEEMYDIISHITPQMPETHARYLMGVGDLSDCLVAVERGFDMFDCVMPTRNARNGTLFTSQGRVSIKRTEYRTDAGRSILKQLSCMQKLFACVSSAPFSCKRDSFDASEYDSQSGVLSQLLPSDARGNSGNFGAFKSAGRPILPGGAITHDQ